MSSCVPSLLKAKCLDDSIETKTAGYLVKIQSAHVPSSNDNCHAFSPTTFGPAPDCDSEFDNDVKCPLIMIMSHFFCTECDHTIFLDEKKEILMK